MRVELKFFASLDKAASKGTVAVELDKGSTVMDLLKQEDVNVDEVGILVVNAKSATFDQPLSDGDIVTVIPHIGGG